ncbi:MAG: biotin/lipoyl-binding protein [Candidatus Gracilibacteria bacterium]
MKTYISIALISILLLTSCGQEAPKEKKFYETALVTTGSISGTDRVISTVEGSNTVDLSFKASGRVTNVFVKPGDKVKKGDILAVLGNEEGSIASEGLSSVLSNLSGISESIDSLYASRLDNLTNDTTKAQIGIQIAERDLELAKSTLASSTAIFSGSSLSDREKISQAEKSLEYARNNLTNSTKLLVTQGESLRRNALNSLSNAFIIARNARDFTDEVLGVTDANRAKNDLYQNYLGAKNTTTKTDAENAFRIFNTEYETMYTWYYANIIGKTDISKETLNEALARSLTTMEHLRDMLHALSTVLENSIISSTFPDTDLAGLKNKTSTFLSNLGLTILDNFGNGIKGSMTAIGSFDSDYILKVQQLQDAVNIAEESLNLAKTGKDISSNDVKKNRDILTANIDFKEDALEIAKVALLDIAKNRKILESERDSKLQEMGAKISETRLNYNLANNTIKSGMIIAPFDGIMLTRNIDLGSTVSALQPIFSLTSTDGYVIKANFDSIQTPLVVGKKVKLSRLSDSLLTEANVKNLREEADFTHNKQYVELEPVGKELRIGDRVELLLEKKDDENKQTDIILPTSAIITKYGETGVYVLENGQVKYTLITVLASDGNMTAISGLKTEQRVITKGKENILDGEVLK